MKNINSRKSIVKLAAFLAALAALLGISVQTGLFSSIGNVFQGIHFDPESVMRLVIMVLLVLAIENLILFILGLLHPQKNRSQTLIALLGSVLRYVTAIVILCWGLTILGADVGTVVAGVGVIALIVGFGAESLIADLVTGVFMLFENQYNVGDYVEVGGFRGKVTSIGVRVTCL
jgi:small conductance mechanosensitive channel